MLWGYSLGGSVAANLATKHKDVRGVIMQAPIDSAADVVSSFLPLTGWSLARILTQKFETKATISSVKSCLLQVGERILFSITHVNTYYEMPQISPQHTCKLSQKLKNLQLA